MTPVQGLRYQLIKARGEWLQAVKAEDLAARCELIQQIDELLDQLLDYQRQGIR